MNEVLNQSWIQIFSLFLANTGLLLWFRAESRNDWRHMDTKIDAIQKEMKDFHGRLEKQDAEFKAHLLELAKKNV